MDILKFNLIFNDKHAYSLKNLKCKYPDDFSEYLSVLKELYYKSLPICDLSGEKIVFVPARCNVKISAFKTFLSVREKAYSEKAVEDEIISTAKIESIDYTRESVRNILKGFAPRDDAE